MKTQIRLAELGDLFFIQNCARLAYEKYIERIGKEPAPMIADFASAIDQKQVQIVENAGETVGFVVSFARNDVLFIENIALLPAYQGKGIARGVFEILEIQATDDGRSALELYTNEKMTENLGLYARLGFVEIDRRNENGFDRVYFLKLLS